MFWCPPSLSFCLCYNCNCNPEIIEMRLRREKLGGDQQLTPEAASTWTRRTRVYLIERQCIACSPNPIRSRLGKDRTNWRSGSEGDRGEDTAVWGANERATAGGNTHKTSEAYLTRKGAAQRVGRESLLARLSRPWSRDCLAEDQSSYWL